MKLKEILRVTLPSGCQLEGRVITLSPTNEIHFDGGRVMSVAVDTARDAELKMVEFATNSSIYNVRSGNPGPSLSEANLMWKDHVVAQNTAWTWWATLKAGLATCVVLIILMMGVKSFVT